MTAILANAINNAARDLPAGWLIELCVERGAGWVELYNPDGDRHELEELADSTLGEQVMAAINEALRASGAAPAQETRAGHETSEVCACADLCEHRGGAICRRAER